MMKYTIEPTDEEGIKNAVSFGVDMETGELVISTVDEEIRASEDEARELIALLNQKYAIYLRIKKTKENWIDQFILAVKNWSL
jgi:hypothetical protein